MAADMRSGTEESTVTCRWLINCAGLQAITLLPRIHGYPASRLRRAYFAKGNYSSCQAAKGFQHLVYPLAGSGGLGIHAMLDLDGAVRFSPDVEWVTNSTTTSIRPAPSVFTLSVREYWPGLPDGPLQPAYAGIRPKLVSEGESPIDFLIEGPAEHGLSGLVNLLGIESPGLTASLAIGEEVARRIGV